VVGGVGVCEYSESCLCYLYVIRRRIFVRAVNSYAREFTCVLVVRVCVLLTVRIYVRATCACCLCVRFVRIFTCVRACSLFVRACGLSVRVYCRLFDNKSLYVGGFRPTKA
jgi:hypothetical protein